MKYFLFIVLLSSCSFFNKTNHYSDFNFSDKKRDELIKDTDKLVIIHFYNQDYADDKKSYLKFHKKNKNFKLLKIPIEENIDWFKFYRNTMFRMKKLPTLNYQLTAIVTPDLKPLFVSDVWSESSYNTVLKHLEKFWRENRSATISKSIELMDEVNFFPVNKIKEYKVNKELFGNTFASLNEKKELDYYDLMFLINFSYLTDNPSFSKRSRELIFKNYKKILKDDSISNLKKMQFLDTFNRRFQENLKIDTLQNLFIKEDKLKEDIEKIINRDYNGNVLKKKNKIYSLEEVNHLLSKLYYAYNRTLDRYYLVKYLFIVKFMERTYWSEDWHMLREKSSHWQVAPYFYNNQKKSVIESEAVYHAMISCAITKDNECFKRYSNFVKLAIVRSIKNPKETTNLYSLLFLKHNEFKVVYISNNKKIIELNNKFYTKPTIVIEKYFNDGKDNFCVFDLKIDCQNYNNLDNGDILKEIFNRKRL